MLKTFLLVLVAVILGGAGHVMLAKGVKPVGDLTEAPSGRLGATFKFVAYTMAGSLLMLVSIIVLGLSQGTFDLVDAVIGIGNTHKSKVDKFEQFGLTPVDP